MDRNIINVGIGFATGRKSFKKVLNTYAYNWRECGLDGMEKIRLNLFVAYDLKYSKTKSSDYTVFRDDISELFENEYYIGKNEINDITERLKYENTVSSETAHILFGSGYAAKRNAILFSALEKGMDCVLFLDDDEYPLAVTNAHSVALWSGQHVLSSHLRNIKNADITNGYHCGYVSPVPYIRFDGDLTEDTFRRFIVSISSDVLGWDSMREIINNGGVTYADTKVLAENRVSEVAQENSCKFITGSNLCINLTRPKRVLPFFNPPGARGEDTFLSTCLTGHTVLRIPCYTFHDGFGVYKHLMDGVLPINLKYITADASKVTERFYRACVGWIRYKPLYIYLTDTENYSDRITEDYKQLSDSLPDICNYFGRKDFMNLRYEMKRYSKNVKRHSEYFTAAKNAWADIMELFDI